MYRKTLAAGAALCLVLLCVPVMLWAQLPGLPNGWSNGFVYANGIRIHYYQAVPAPGKPVIVMAHGVSDNGLCWTTLSQELQGAFNIYMVDARGHGLTDPPTAADSSDAMVKDLVGFVQKMKFEKPILMGHSMGSGTVIRLGADYPDLPKAVIMLDPSLRNAATAAGRVQGTMPSAIPVTETASAGLKKNTVIMSGTPEALVAQNNYNYQDLLEIGRRQNPMWADLDIQYWALSKKQYHGNFGTGIRRTAAHTDQPLAKIKVPALILKADASPEQRKINEVAASIMQQGKLVHIDGAGHNLHHDKLKRCLQELREFLTRL